MRTAIATITFSYDEVYAPERLEEIITNRLNDYAFLKVNEIHIEDVGQLLGFPQTSAPSFPPKQISNSNVIQLDQLTFMANKNTKRSNKLARKARAAKRWSKLLQRNADLHKHTVRRSHLGYPQ